MGSSIERVIDLSVPFFENEELHVSLVRGDKIALIDSGMSSTPKDGLIPLLGNLGLTLSDVDYILHTHGHFDHKGGDAEIKALGKAKIVVHESESTLIEDYDSFHRNWSKVAYEMIGAEAAEAEWEMYATMWGEQVPVDMTIRDGATIDLGGCALKAVHIPGHSAGSVAWYLEEEGMLFTGDGLQGANAGDEHLPIIEFLEDYKKSVQKLLDMPIRTIVTAHALRDLHSPPVYKREGDAATQFLRDCYEIADTITSAIGKVAQNGSGKPFMKLFNEVIRQLPKEWGYGEMPEEGFPPFIVFRASGIFTGFKRLNAI